MHLFLLFLSNTAIAHVAPEDISATRSTGNGRGPTLAPKQVTRTYVIY